MNERMKKVPFSAFQERSARETSGHTLGERHRLINECQHLRMPLIGDLGTCFQNLNYSTQPTPEA